MLMRLYRYLALAALPLVSACHGLIPSEPEVRLSWTTRIAEIPSDHHPITIDGVVAQGPSTAPRPRTGSLFGDLQPGRYDVCVSAVNERGEAGPCELVQRVSYP